MGMIWDNLWAIYGFDIGHYPPYQTCMMPCSASLLSYVWERYVFFKNPYHSHIWNDTGYGNGMG